MSNWLARMFTIPRAKRQQINATLESNPALLEIANMLKSAAISAAVSAATEHISDPTAHTAAAVAITTAVERAVPTPASGEDAPGASVPSSVTISTGPGVSVAQIPQAGIKP